MSDQNGISHAVLLPVFCSLSSAIVHVSMSPVYGSTLVSSTHGITGGVALLFVCLTNWLSGSISATLWTSLLPCFASLTPIILPHAFELSTQLGPTWGPLFTDMVATLPIIFCSAHAIMQLYGSSAGPKVLLCGLFCVIILAAETFSESLIHQACSKHAWVTRSSLQTALIPISAYVFPSKLALGVLPVWIYTAVTSTYLPSNSALVRLNSQLQLHNFTVLERRDSVTGYISVLENSQEHVRLLRCDHSFLGGEWLVSNRDLAVPEPVYPVFTMLEAVRLMEWPDEDQITAEVAKSALVVGLGVGTCAKAFAELGVATTVIEIDPFVTYFSRKYFNLPESVTVIHSDAASYIQAAAKPVNSISYDYIIHDVFTGGVEPLELFTKEFLAGLSSILKLDGSVAINFAGDLNHELTAIIWDTISSVFHHCRAFREFQYSTPTTQRSSGTDMSNLAIFCTKKDVEWRFRTPVEADFLHSQARRQYLLPKHEIRRSHLKSPSDQTRLLDSRTVRKFARWQTSSALVHWELLRGAIPTIVWEKY